MPKKTPARKDPAVDAPMYAAEAANAATDPNAPPVWKGNDDLRPLLMPLAVIDPDPDNLRIHGEGNLADIQRSLKTFGQTKPIVIWREDGGKHPITIAGNGTMESMKALGWTHVAVSEFRGTYAAARAYAFIDNATALTSEWAPDVEDRVTAINTDFAAENAEWSADPSEVPGAPEPEKEKHANSKTNDGKTTRERESENGETFDPDAVITGGVQIHPGDLFQLGAHRIICGDSTDLAVVARLMGDARAAFVHADPPYGLNKAGVTNDDLHGDRLDVFQSAWWKVARAHLIDNGGAFVWGNAEDLWRWWYRHLTAPAKEGEPPREVLSMRNEIVWDKGDGAGMASGEMRSWAVTTERAIFFMLGDQELDIDSKNFWPGWEPLRAALAAECEKAGWTQKDLHRITGTVMGKHWITRSQWTFITEAHYAKLQEAGREFEAFQFPYADVRAVYEAAKIQFDQEVKAAFYAGRTFFDNTHDNMGECWTFPRVVGDERHGHSTPKPIALMNRVLRSCCPAGALVFEPFAGSGSTLISAEETGRQCFTIDIEPNYVATTIARWEKMTGLKAEKIG